MFNQLITYTRSISNMYAPMRAAAPREGDDREFPAVDIANAARQGMELSIL